MKKFLCLALALVMVFAMVTLASCGGSDDTSSEPTSGDTSETSTEATPGSSAENPIEFSGNYTYKDSVVTMATNWNPHTYETSDDSYPADFLRCGFYTFVFNDNAVVTAEGKDPFDAYEIIPEMAAAMPVDVTEEIKAQDNNKWNIPADVTKGYAYKIALNPKCCWEDGTPIKAEDYVKSAELLFRTELQNYRATDYYGQQISIANAEHYANIGSLIKVDNEDALEYSVDNLTVGEDGIYVTDKGEKVAFPITKVNNYFGDASLFDYVEAYGDQYFNMEHWEEIKAAVDENGIVYMTEETRAWMEDLISNPAWGEGPDYLPHYMWIIQGIYDEMEFDGNVGVLATGEYELTLIFDRSLTGFYLLYNLSGNWLVKTDLYEECLEQVNDAWISTYNTSPETTLSYGPYKMTSYQADKQMVFEKNEKWWGWTDASHVYKDPDDGLFYRMYQTTKIDCQVVEEASTRLEMFKKGELMTYGLQAEDFATYGKSEYVYATPSETIYFLILNGNLAAIQEREASGDIPADCDTETITLPSFRLAMATTYDKEDFAATVSPARTGGYAIVGETYIYDPETCAYYRDTEQAKKALCTFYGVDVSKYENLDAAAASITGYDPEGAKENYQKAFEEALEAGYITDADNDGKSDQKIQIVYTMSGEVTAFIQKTLDYLNTKANEVAAGTGFEGKITFVAGPNVGNAWATNLKAGLSDTCLCGWSGSAMDPFSLTDLYTNPAYQYDAGWFNASKVNLTLKVDGKDLTMNLKEWSDALNGATVTKDGKEYNFGDGQADVDFRLEILAAIEVEVLKTYDYIPVLQNASKFLLTKQVWYITEKYNPVMGRGGMTYMKYQYNDEEWAEFCKNPDNLNY